MRIKIRNKLITESVLNMLYQAKRELTNGKLSVIDPKRGDNILITCPNSAHKGGKERHPSCQILADENCELEVGFAHCFTCGYNAPFSKVIADLFNESDEFGEEWLVERFGNTFVEHVDILPEIILTPEREKRQYLDESILTEYDFYHPYMWQRKLSKEVVDEFRIGYDKQRDAITFPVYDEKHRLVMVTARSVGTKRFWIPEGVDKPVYLLYDVLEKHQDTVFVCESQINSLYLRSVLNVPSVCLFGTGSQKQYDILRKSGIRNYYLMFDGDSAGANGALRFRKNMPRDVFITDVRLPAGKDVNDLSRDELIQLLNNS